MTIGILCFLMMISSLPKNARPSWYWEVDSSTARKWDVQKRTQDEIIQQQKEELSKAK